jgi:predicted nucleic acid-binding protein
LDTNVVIGFLAGADWAVDFVSRATADNATFSVSVITRMELLAFPGITPDEESKIDDFLSRVSVIAIDPELEIEAIALRRSTGLKLPDAIIAGTATTIGATLVSADSDFEKIGNAEFLNPLNP